MLHPRPIVLHNGPAVTLDPYYERFGALEPQIAMPPPPNTGLIIVIPCFNEPNLLLSLQALWDCKSPQCAVEVFVVINSPANAPPAIREQNQQTLLQAQEWARSWPDQRFHLHLLYFPALPPKHAGVGLARKIGMDEAARRFDAIGRPDGVIVCFDADSLCDSNYLCALENHFTQNPRTPGCSLYFEHPLNGALPGPVYEAITLYELHLRYYVQALRLAEFPYAFHTIGSSMAVRAQVYKKQGGMNKRQAGEDFYFLHKVIPLGDFTDLTATRVVPSPRCSNRVPFGTGKAVGEYLQNGDLKTYPLEAFLDLRLFVSQVRMLGGKAFSRDDVSKWPVPIMSYLEAQNFSQVLQDIQSNTSTHPAFLKRFWHWFNGFQVMKFVHFARDNFYSHRSIPHETARLLELLNGGPMNPELSSRDLLLLYRNRDRLLD
jgi:hypothetical protein